MLYTITNGIHVIRGQGLPPESLDQCLPCRPKQARSQKPYSRDKSSLLGYKLTGGKSNDGEITALPSVASTLAKAKSEKNIRITRILLAVGRKDTVA